MPLNTFSLFEPVRVIHCQAALDLGAGVKQPFDCLVIQKRLAMRSTGTSMDWTVKDNMVNRLFHFATLTSSRRGNTSFVQTGT